VARCVIRMMGCPLVVLLKSRYSNKRALTLF
jgi:hypothetical protein